MKFRSTFSSILVAVLAITPVVLAHHSFAMFDLTKEIELAGVVKEFQWTNPHIWIELEVADNGKTLIHSIEGSSPNGLSRKGWTRNTFKAGDKVKVVVNPLKTGEPGGAFVRATGADGAAITR